MRTEVHEMQIYNRLGHILWTENKTYKEVRCRPAASDAYGEWDRDLVSYALPALALACQLWVSDCKIGQDIN